MFKKLLALNLTALLISSLAVVNAVNAEALLEKIINFENDTWFTLVSSDFKLEKVSSSGGDISFPSSAGSTALKLTGTSSSKLANITEPLGMSSGIIEQTMDFYFKNDNGTIGSEYIGIGLSMNNTTLGYNGRYILWRIVASEDNKISFTNDNKWSETKLIDDTWYTFKTVINIDKAYYEIFYKQTDTPDSWKKFEFSKGLTKQSYAFPDSGENKIDDISLYSHQTMTTPQYVDNISVKTYAKPASYVREVIDLIDLEGASYVISGGELYYQINKLSTAPLENAAGGIIDISFDTVINIPDNDNTMYDIGFSEGREYDKDGKLISFIKAGNISAKNGAWLSQNMMTSNKKYTMRLTLNTAVNPAELRGTQNGKDLSFPRSYEDKANPQLEPVYVYDGKQTSSDKNNNGSFIDNINYLVFNPGTADCNVSLNYINNFSATVYEPLYVAVNSAADSAELKEICKKYSELSELTLNDKADYDKIFAAMTSKKYSSSDEVRADYELLCTPGDVKADIDDKWLNIRFINDTDLKDGVIILAMYKANSLESCVLPSFLNADYSALSHLKISLDTVIDKADYDKIRLFIWSDTTDTIIPLTKTAIIK